jgi:hypothetical protein
MLQLITLGPMEQPFRLGNKRQTSIGTEQRIEAMGLAFPIRNVRSLVVVFDKKGGKLERLQELCGLCCKNPP